MSERRRLPPRRETGSKRPGARKKSRSTKQGGKLPIVLGVGGGVLALALGLTIFLVLRGPNRVEAQSGETSVADESVEPSSAPIASDDTSNGKATSDETIADAPSNASDNGEPSSSTSEDVADDSGKEERPVLDLARAPEIQSKLIPPNTKVEWTVSRDPAIEKVELSFRNKFGHSLSPGRNGVLTINGKTAVKALDWNGKAFDVEFSLKDGVYDSADTSDQWLDVTKLFTPGHNTVAFEHDAIKEFGITFRVKTRSSPPATNETVVDKTLLARLEVENATASMLPDEGTPPYLRGGLVYERKPGAVVTVLRPKQPGPVYISILLQSYETNVHNSVEQRALNLRNDGWIALGPSPWKETAGRQLFVREFQQDEVDKPERFAGRKDEQPWVIVPADPKLPDPDTPGLPATARRVFTATWAMRALDAKDYASLDARAAGYLADESSSGARRLNDLLLALAPDHRRNKKSREYRRAKLEDWVKTVPESDMAKLALAWAVSREAWIARGGAFAADTDPEQLRAFEEGMRSAETYVKQVRARSPEHPLVYHLTISTAIGSRAGPDAVREAYSNLLEQAPDYIAVYDSLVNYFLPRWHGDLDVHVELAEMAAERTREEFGDAHYALMALHLTRWHPMGVFGPFGFDWDRVKAGYADLRRTHPGETYLVDYFRYAACVANDLEAARAAFDELGGAYDPYQWKYTGAYDDWANFAAGRSPKGQLAQILAHEGQGTAVAFSHDGKYVATSGCDYTVRLWTNELPPRPLKDFSSGRACVHSLAFRPDGSTLVGFASDGESVGAIVEYPIEGPGTGEQRPMGLPPDVDFGGRLSSNGASLALVVETSPPVVVLFDTRTAEPRFKPFQGKPVSRIGYAPSKSIAVSDDDSLLAAAGAKQLSIYDPKSGRELVNRPSPTIEKYTNDYSGIALSHDGKYLYGAMMANGDYRLYRWPARRKSAPEVLEVEKWWGSIAEVCPSRDGDRVAVGVQNRRPAVYDFGTKRATTVDGLSSSAAMFAWSPDGKRLAMLTKDKCLRIFDADALFADAPAADID